MAGILRWKIRQQAGSGVAVDIFEDLTSGGQNANLMPEL
jgi:hypothetical protein